MIHDLTSAMERSYQNYRAYMMDAALFGTSLSFEKRCEHEERMQRMEHTLAARELRRAS